LQKKFTIVTSSVTIYATKPFYFLNNVPKVWRASQNRLRARAEICNDELGMRNDEFKKSSSVYRSSFIIHY